MPPLIGHHLEDPCVTDTVAVGVTVTAAKAALARQGLPRYWATAAFLIPRPYEDGTARITRAWGYRCPHAVRGGLGGNQPGWGTRPDIKRGEAR